VDVKGDLTPEYRQKSHVHFQKRLGHLERRWDRALAHPDGERVLGLQTAILSELSTLVKDARDALEAWLRTPDVAGVEPERGSFLWKCQIADDKRDLEAIKTKYTVSTATVYRYRAKYKGLRRVAA
jgi:hypothetical protein